MKSQETLIAEAHAVKCELAAEVLRSSGRLRLQVTGWSMLPTVWPGDTLIIERAQSSFVAEGDIVLFGREGRLIAHRVVATKTQGARGILTRGDAMRNADPPLQEDAVLGRISSIVRNGRRIQPSRTMKASNRAVAGLVRFSNVTARAIVGVHGMMQKQESVKAGI